MDGDDDVGSQMPLSRGIGIFRQRLIFLLRYVYGSEPFGIQPLRVSGVIIASRGIIIITSREGLLYGRITKRLLLLLLLFILGWYTGVVAHEPVTVKIIYCQLFACQRSRGRRKQHEHDDREVVLRNESETEPASSALNESLSMAMHAAA